VRTVPRPGYCQAVVAGSGRLQIDHAQMCQNRGAHHVFGILLCGIHVNADDANPGTLKIVTTMPMERTAT
jgi:hypothetical protein